MTNTTFTITLDQSALKTKPVPQQCIWNTIPEILYEAPSSPGEQGNPIPYVEVPQNKAMPPVLFVFEYKRTGEYEPGHKGKPAEIVDQIPHQYVDLQFLTERLNDPVLVDVVRCSMGLKPLREAQVKGAKILSTVLGKEQAIKESVLKGQPERIANIIKTKLEEQDRREAELAAKEQTPSEKAE